MQKNIKVREFTVSIRPGEDGWLVVECLELPGCITQGKTLKEAKANAEEAIQCYLESLKKHNEPIPSSKTKFSKIKIEA
ncbi:MAG: type II toxin-antitoxin system HicB family antitoxin [Candidatus Diapherotrites archaeon]